MDLLKHVYIQHRSAQNCFLAATVHEPLLEFHCQVHARGGPRTEVGWLRILKADQYTSSGVDAHNAIDHVMCYYRARARLDLTLPLSVSSNGSFPSNVPLLLILDTYH